MNEKEKMIEELAKYIRSSLRLHIDKTILYPYLATDLYKSGYRKVTEGAVVLDRHEAQKYFAYKHIEPQIKGCLDRERELEKQLAELEEQRDRQAYIAEELIQEKHRWTEQARKETEPIKLTTIGYGKENGCYYADIIATGQEFPQRIYFQASLFEKEEIQEETAKEILKLVKEKSWCCQEDESGEVWTYSITVTQLKELAEKYGVKVEK